MEARKISDYIYLYLGCEVLTIVPGDSVKERFIMNEIDKGVLMLAEKGFMKPILRPLSDITEEENQETSKLYFDFMETQEPGQRDIKMMAHMTQWFLSRHFDLFNLIPEGLAIDKSLLTEGSVKL